MLASKVGIMESRANGMKESKWYIGNLVLSHPYGVSDLGLEALPVSSLLSSISKGYGSKDKWDGININTSCPWSWDIPADENSSPLQILL